MAPRMLTRRARQDPDAASTHSVLLDEAMQHYVEWRQECLAVDDAYEAWASAPAHETELPHAVYIAALDREQCAAGLYRRAIELLEGSS